MLAKPTVAAGYLCFPLYAFAVFLSSSSTRQRIPIISTATPIYLHPTTSEADNPINQTPSEATTTTPTTFLGNPATDSSNQEIGTQKCLLSHLVEADCFK